MNFSLCKCFAILFLFFIVPTHARHYTLTLKSHIKTLKIRPYMFRSPLKPSSGGPWPYFVKLLNWNVDLHLLLRVGTYLVETVSTR